MLGVTDVFFFLWICFILRHGILFYNRLYAM